VNISSTVVAATVALGLTAAFAQQQPHDPTRTPGVQAPADPNRTAFVAANCKNPAAAGRAGGGGAAATAQPEPEHSYSVTGIPGVVAAGRQWRTLWRDSGNNADSPIGLADGVLIAQNDKSQIVKVGLNGQATLLATDTYTGGALAMNAKGQLFSGQRALNKAIWLIQPERRLFANTKDGEPLECLGPANISDMIADSKGGVYFTMGGVYYANAQGIVTGRHTSVNGNGLILSGDGKTLYVTGRLGATGRDANAGLVALDVQPDGSLTNERQFATLPGGDGLAIDSDGRIYATTGNDGVYVFSPTGELLGNIPAPRGLISVAFGGPDKRTLFGVAIRDVQIMALEMIAQGFTGRPK
jgi:sugar lactone lactonase YvrE